jgi:hypothetical protein
MPLGFLDPRVDTGSREENASNQKLERVYDSIKSERALGLGSELEPRFR